jgi:hypothetical protein
MSNRQDGLLLSVIANKETYKAGEPVEVTCSFTNISEVSIPFRSVVPEFSFFYRFIVVRSVGVDSVAVALTPEGKRQADVYNLWARRDYNMPPGAEKKSVFKLNELFEMDAPGLYKILVVVHLRTQISGRTMAEFRSDLLTLRIN